MDLTQSITQATQEIFETMLGMEVTAHPPLETRVTSFQHSISGLIGLAGPYKGMLAIHIPEPVAKTITSNFLCMEIEEINDDVKDALGELANMLAGNIKTSLGDEGSDIKLSIPSAVCGEEYTIDSFAEGGDRAVIPFSVEGGEFLVECQLQKQP